jgi:hypothetical protein
MCGTTARSSARSQKKLVSKMAWACSIELSSAPLARDPEAGVVDEQIDAALGLHQRANGGIDRSSLVTSRAASRTIVRAHRRHVGSCRRPCSRPREQLRRAWPMPDDAPVTCAILVISLFVFMRFLGQDSEVAAVKEAVA